MIRKAIAAGVALCVSGCASLPITEGNTPAVVATSAGLVQGSLEDGIRVYRGIPYAAAPVGDLRWRAPQPKNWDALLNATAFGPACLQPINADGSPNFGGYAGPVSEDCLTLNIWSPAGAQGAPIMPWLFGGGGVVGDGSLSTYHGESFAQDGVILVTINYRLGGLGGFAHPALTAEKAGGPNANYALMDSLAALKWIKENARAFGGDPDNITLFGESAGATMTANLVTSPLAEGLFAKAIFESTGSLAAPATPLAKAEALGAKAASNLGLAGASATAAQLRAIDAQRFLDDKIAGFGLRTIADAVVQPSSIMEIYQAGRQNDVMLMIGTNSDEGRLEGTQQIAALAEKRGPVFQYFFDYVPTALQAEHPNGAPHAGELPFVFDTLDRYPLLAGKTITERDRLVAKLTHACWVAFAKAQRNTEALDCGEMLSWPARTTTNGHAVARLGPEPSILAADSLQSPPNGEKPGKTSRP